MILSLRWAGVSMVVTLLVAACALKDAPADKPAATRADTPEKKKTPAATSTASVPKTDVMTRLGAVGVMPLEVPDFSALPLKDKRAVNALTTALDGAETVNFAMAGDRILRTKRVLEGILRAKARVPLSIREKIAPYAERFFLNVGPVDTFTGERIRPGFIPGELAAAAKAALDSGIDLGVEEVQVTDLGANRLEQLEALLADIRVPIFGPKKGDDAQDTQTEPPASRDVDDTAYMAALDHVATPIRRLAGTVPEGPEKTRLDALIAYLTSPTTQGFSAYADTFTSSALDVEAFLGPFGAADGPGGLRRFQGLVAVRAEEESPTFKKLASLIPDFERKLPGNAMFVRSRKSILIPIVDAYHLVAAAPVGAVSEPGFRFPSPHGAMRGPSKVMLFTNVQNAEDRARGDLYLRTLSAEGTSRARRAKWRRAADTAFLALKYVVGFELGSRKESDLDDKGGMAWFSTQRGVVAEMHADLAALHFAFDPALQSLGLVPEAECAVAILEGYLSRFLAEAPLEGNPASSGGRAVVARRIVVRRLLNVAGVRVKKEAGEYVVSVEDVEAVRNGVAELLAEAQRMVSLGEEKSGRRLIEESGGPLPKAWRDDVTARLDRLDIPVQWTYGYPKRKAKRDAAGELTDLVLLPSVAP